VSSLEEVKLATIRIEAQGSFVEPEAGLQMNVAGSGSGFIIDESGLAVTNNHVVTGAAFLQVYVEGEEAPLNAKILGVSECSDLAVIDIDGEGFHYLEWYDGALNAGLDVYTAGFPLGDPEFTLTRGIISKERADGETNWASVDAVIEHDATINPGNSGGPLVTADGKVVAVNYAAATSTNQYYAIARSEALKIIDQLSAGQDVDSIGVNGEAVNDGEGLSGIWVASVKSGSPADSAGVQGGDIIFKMEGLLLATDGTMADYCDILRSHQPSDALGIEVLRFETQEVLAGQLNGRGLEATFSFADELSDEVADTSGATYSGYSYIYDDSGAIQVEVPDEWTDTNGGAWLRDDQEIGAAISASSNLDDFWNTYSTPGIFFGASAILAQNFDEATFLDSLTDFSQDCVYEGRFEYSDPIYDGYYDFYTDCSDAGSQIINIVATPQDQQFLIWVQTQVVSDQDLEALDYIINSFEVVGTLPAGDVTTGLGSGGAPVPMNLFEGGAFSIEYPQVWNESSIDMLGLTMAIFAIEQLDMEDMENLDFENMMSEDPVAFVMVVPPEMASDMGVADLDMAIDEFDDAIPEENAEIIQQGEIVIGGAPGRIVVAKGTDPDIGEVGIHLVVARLDDGTTVVFLGATPGPDVDGNLAIFDYMQNSFQFR
jgi:serine protease Do